MPEEVWEALPILRDASRGRPPVLGGTLDQAEGFSSALAVYESITDRLKVRRE